MLYFHSKFFIYFHRKLFIVHIILYLYCICLKFKEEYFNLFVLNHFLVHSQEYFEENINSGLICCEGLQFEKVDYGFYFRDICCIRLASTICFKKHWLNE